MEIGVSSCERKPVATVTVGSVTISIYASPVTVRPEAKPAAVDSSQSASVPDSKTYESFQVVHYEGNRRIFQRRNTLEKAKALAKEIAGRLHRDGSRALYFTEKDRRIYTLAQVKSESLGLEVDEVCRKYGELQQRLKTGTLEEAVDFFNSHGQRVRHGATIESVYAEYLQHLTKRGVGIYHLRDVKRYVGTVSERSKPASRERMKTSHFEEHIALSAVETAQERDESTQHELATFNNDLGGAWLVSPAHCAGTGHSPRDGGTTFTLGRFKAGQSAHRL